MLQINYVRELSQLCSAARTTSKTTNSVDRQTVRWQISYEANICFDIGIIVVKLMIAVSKIEVVAKCIIFCSLMSSQAAPQKCSELLTANLVMDGQNLSEVEV